MAKNEKAQAAMGSDRDLIFPDHHAQDIFAKINLGPVNKHENNLEKANRCWELLKYLVSSKAHRMLDGLAFQQLRPSKMLRWSMITICHRGCKHISLAHPSLSLRNSHLILHWLHLTCIRGLGTLDVALEVGEEKGLKIPTSKCKMSQEPREFTSTAMFRDYIRVMFNYRELGLNLHTAALHYHSE
ncbi:hypothetical protein PENPOL_c017G04198 [Penicillium polonicum]|uniref:Uncharacterized protein n=1 Tax=Penicillium polonicum TaxID=60169 RepID=A0A1V6N9U3_PENPO|nr:hypothetical protein PENPOL_c017G04198 [Penicillium polonicum]